MEKTGNGFVLPVLLKRPSFRTERSDEPESRDDRGIGFPRSRERRVLASALFPSRESAPRLRKPPTWHRDCCVEVGYGDVEWNGQF